MKSVIKAVIAVVVLAGVAGAETQKLSSELPGIYSKGAQAVEQPLVLMCQDNPQFYPIPADYVPPIKYVKFTIPGFYRPYLMQKGGGDMYNPPAIEIEIQFQPSPWFEKNWIKELGIKNYSYKGTTGGGMGTVSFMPYDNEQASSIHSGTGKVTFNIWPIIKKAGLFKREIAGANAEIYGKYEFWPNRQLKCEAAR